MKNLTWAKIVTSVLAAAIPGIALAATNPAGPVDVNIFVNIAKKTVPSVVNISTFSKVKSPNMQSPPDELFRQFWEDFFRKRGMPGPRGRDQEEDDDQEQAPPPGGPPSKSGPRAQSLGSGFIIDASGLILTNNHVVADADEIKIKFTESTDEKETDGEVVGRDPDLDVALIRVKTKRELSGLSFGDSDSLEVGEYVAAIGNPFGQGHSITHGIISAKGRLAPDFPIASYLQTDAPINPGNSGGPLVNLKGEVIGINNAIDQRAQGIGFAIPINLVKKVLEQLKTKGTVSRGYIGVLVNELNPDLAQKMSVGKDLIAPFVTHVYPNEPADKAGLKPYDVILEFAGKAVHSSRDLIAAVTSVAVGDSAPIKILRGGKEKELKITVAQRPGQPQLADRKKDKEGKGKSKKQVRMDTGMAIDELTPEIARELGMPEKTKGVLVSNVNYDSPADRAGIIRGDVIIEVDRKPVKDSEEFFALVKEKKSYLLRVRRQDPQGHELFTVVVLNLKEN